MRFVPDGPDIPNELIRRWRDGKVIFLAGAGVSVPSNLPLFRGLALGIFERLGDSLHQVLLELIQADASTHPTILDAHQLTPDRRVEIELFLEKQYDRVFSALERRIDQTSSGLLITLKVRNAVHAILSAASHSDLHRDLIRPSLAEPQGGAPICRLATTNFDLLFESAWIEELKTEVTSFDARIAPRAGAHNFGGIIHLHGMLDLKKPPGEFILSSRDFARFYLRSGAIGNYVYDLIRRYTVVLVGYSADDPPMRYLRDAVGEDISLFEDMNQPYAIASRKPDSRDPDGAIAQAVWRTKNIEPVLFMKSSDGDGFGPLRETLSLWADWARGWDTWFTSKLQEMTAVPYGGTGAFEQAFVRDLLSTLEEEEVREAIKHLNNASVDFSWIDAINAALDESQSV